MHLGILAAGSVVVVGGGTVAVLASAPEPPDGVTVTKVVDGDTIDVSAHGKTERVRLLNIDAPESVKPESPVECLGPEASAFLKHLLPVGTPVTLEYDMDRTDGYGRTLAAVRLQGGGLANTAVAAAGLAVPMTVGPNDKYRPAVDSAFAKAEREHKGFFSADNTCTVPAKTKKVNDAMAVFSADPGSATAAQRARLTASTLALSSMLDASNPGAAVQAVAVSGMSLTVAKNAVESANNLARQAHPRATKSPDAPSTTARAPKPRTTSAPTRGTAQPPVPRQTYSPPPRSTYQPPAPAPSYTPPPVQRTHDPAPPNPDWHCRSYAPGGKTFKYIPCPK